MEGEDALSVELDMFGWDVDKALGLLRESNPALLDWFALSFAYWAVCGIFSPLCFRLRSPIIYYADEAFYAQLMALARKHFQARALTHHYINMARVPLFQYLVACTLLACLPSHYNRNTTSSTLRVRARQTRCR
jgi:predicted nucleotidyltransferase